jgi:hypothetical protein
MSKANGEINKLNMPLQEKSKNLHTESLVSSQSSGTKNVNQSQISIDPKKNYEELFQNRREMLKNAKGNNFCSNPNLNSEKNEFISSTTDASSKSPHK